MTYESVISELRAIAERSAEAAERGGREDELLEAYVTLRERAVALATAKRLATAERLADQFPSPRALREIERLDVAFGPDSSPGPPQDRGLPARLTEALVGALRLGDRRAARLRDAQGRLALERFARALEDDLRDHAIA